MIISPYNVGRQDISIDGYYFRTEMLITSRKGSDMGRLVGVSADISMFDEFKSSAMSSIRSVNIIIPRGRACTIIGDLFLVYIWKDLLGPVFRTCRLVGCLADLRDRVVLVITGCFV